MKAAARCFVVLILAAGVPVSAQQAPPEPAPAFGESVEVEVVNVDVVVTDKSGRRVRDLTQEDFILEVDGRVVPIEYFAPPRVRSELAADPSQPGEPQPLDEAPSAPASLLVFVDQSALGLDASKTVVEQIREYVMERAQAGDRILVAAFSDNLRVLAPGTSDFAAVDAAMNELAKIPAGGTRLAADRAQIEREIRLQGQERSSPGSLSTPLDGGALAGEIRAFADQEVDRQRRLVAALSAWITTFSGIEGRKSLLLATPGISANPTAYLSELADRQQRGIAQDGQVRRGALQTTDLNVYEDFERLLLKAQDARIAVHTIAPREPPPLSNSPEFGSLGTGASAPPPRDASIAEAASSLTRLADATGGRSFAIDTALAEQLDEVTDDAGAAYSLGFTTGPEAGTKMHEIQVRLRRPDLEVRHREAFRRHTPAERIEEALTAAATIDTFFSSFELTLEPGEVVASKRGKKVLSLPIAVRVPIASIGLAPEGKKRPGTPGLRYQGAIRVRFAVRDDKGKIHLGEESKVDVAIPEADLERARSSAWVHRSEVELKPGKQRVAVVVVDQATGVYATTAKDVTVD